jgi:REP element-mobilizing transposase RayT
VQDESSFKCSAFEPRFKVVNSEVKPEKSTDQHLNERKKDPYADLLNSDRIKYQKALALQKLKRDPDTVFMQLNYYFAWNVRYRKPAFNTDEKIVETVYKLFNESSLVVNDFVSLISLAPDHVHVFVESNGELSVEELINRIKEHTGNGLLKECPQLKESFKNDSIWDDAYFVETIS